MLSRAAAHVSSQPAGMSSRPAQGRKKAASRRRDEGDAVIVSDIQQRQEQLDIDRKVVKELSTEIERLSAVLAAKDERIGELERGSVRGGSETEGVTRGEDISEDLPTASSDAAGEGSTRLSRDDAHAVKGIGLRGESTLSRRNRRLGQAPLLRQNERLVEMLYAFMLGGLSIFVLSAIVTWFHDSKAI